MFAQAQQLCPGVLSKPTPVLQNAAAHKEMYPVNLVQQTGDKMTGLLKCQQSK
jgi:hypothetical protein